MSTVEEIEKAIENLPREDFFRLRDWVAHRFEDQWDKEFEENASSGRLGAVASAALKEHKLGKSSPFPSDEKPGFK